jgi:MFS transporter, putative metabolite:H+ symporter
MASEALNSSYHGIAARLDRIPISGFHKKILWLLAGITFCDSVDMAVGGPIGNILQNTYDAAGNQWMTLEQFAVFNSITMVGYLIGGLLSGALSDGIGRKKAVLICGSIFTAFCFVAAGSPDATFLTGCRFFMGLGLGAAFPAGYSALTEFTPPTKRGKYQSYVGLIANCGTLVASAMNMVVLPMLGWRPVFVICGIIGLLVVVLCFAFLDESPRWLAMKGHTAEADAIVSKYESLAASKHGALAEVSDEEINARASEEKVEDLPWSFLFKKKMIFRTLTAMFICFAMNVFVYTVITWTPTILTKNGFDPHMSTTLTVVMQLGIPVGVGALTFYVEKVGRKTILIVTYLLIAIVGPIWASLPTENTALIMIVGFLLCVCTFTNSVTTAAIYLSEPFPTACRIRGAGVANAFGRVAGILSPMWISFMITTSLGTMGVFLINAILAIFMAVWLAIFGVETKGRTLEDITKGLLD